MISRLLTASVLILCATIATARAQSTPEAAPEDVNSVDSIITALYDVISGPANQPRNWDRFRSLLTPTCQFMPIRRTREGSHAHRALTAEQFIQTAGAYFDQNSFYESETARTQDRYGNLVHAFSTYDSYHNPDDKAPFQRGVNSIQLFFEQDRWWIANIAWQPEWPDLPIPEAYRPTNK